MQANLCVAASGLAIDHLAIDIPDKKNIQLFVKKFHCLYSVVSSCQNNSLVSFGNVSILLLPFRLNDTLDKHQVS